MRATIEELCAEIERLAPVFEEVWERATAASQNGGISDELRAEQAVAAEPLRTAINRLEQSTSEKALWDRYGELGDRARGALRTKADLAQEYREATAPARFDPDTGDPLDGLGVLNLAVREQSGNVEVTRVRKIGFQRTRWVLTIRLPGSGEEFELESLTTKQIKTLPNLADRIDEADDDGSLYMPTPQKNSEKWKSLWAGIKAAGEFEDHGATEVGGWHRRIALYVEDNIRELDPRTADGKREALAGTAWPVEDPEGRLWINAGHFLEHLERGRLDADEATVRSALRQLGFASEQFTAKVEGTQPIAALLALRRRVRLAGRAVIGNRLLSGSRSGDLGGYPGYLVTRPCAAVSRVTAGYSPVTRGGGCLLADGRPCSDHGGV